MPAQSRLAGGRRTARADRHARGRGMRVGALVLAAAVASGCSDAGEATTAPSTELAAGAAPGAVAAPSAAGALTPSARPTASRPAVRPAPRSTARATPRSAGRPGVRPRTPRAVPRAAAPRTPPTLRLTPLRSGRGTTWTTRVRHRGAEEFDTGIVKLWLPDGVRAVRGIMVPGFFPGDRPDDPRPEGEAEALALKYHLAVVRHTYTHREGTRDRREAYCRMGSANGLVRALNDLARRSRHREVATAPFVIYEGYSLAGLCSRGIAEAFPARTAVLAYGGMDRLDCTIRGVARIPTLIYGGGADGFTKNIPNELAPCRTRGMPIAVALQPGRGHSISGSKPTRYAYLDAVLAQRLPARPGGALRPIDLRAGFLGDNRSHTYARYDAYRGDKRSASWLPSARAAAEWRRWTTTG